MKPARQTVGEDGSDREVDEPSAIVPIAGRVAKPKELARGSRKSFVRAWLTRLEVRKVLSDVLRLREEIHDLSQELGLLVALTGHAVDLGKGAHGVGVFGRHLERALVRGDCARAIPERLESMSRDPIALALSGFVAVSRSTHRVVWTGSRRASARSICSFVNDGSSKRKAA
jgi:hypothetical protein